MTAARSTGGRHLTPRTAAVLDALDRAWGAGEVDALDAVLAESFMRHGQQSSYTREQLKSSVQDMRRAFPDLVMTVVDVVEGDQTLALRWTSTGTLHDEYLGLPPTGRQFSVSGATFCRFSGDVIAEESVVLDRRGQYSSLGVPLRGSAADESTVSVGDAVDPDALRALHRMLVTGVTVVTVDDAGEPRGLAVNAFASLSLDPPLILICIQKTSSTYARLLAAKHFGVSILAADQAPVARVFATKQDRKFDQVPWHPGHLGVPLVDGASATLEVELQDTLHSRTHTVFIGRVRQVGGSDAPPLVYTRSSFFDGGQLVDAVEPTL